MGAERQASRTCPASLCVWLFAERGSELAWWPLWPSLVPQKAKFLPRL